MTGFQRLTLVTLAATYALIVLGGLVRATDSGLGCPDWPLCHGQVIPPAEKAVLIEYSHRLAATVVGLLIFAVAVVAWRSYRHVPAILAAATGALPVLATQVVLGGITVRRELPPSIVATHLVTALSLLALLTIVAIAAGSVSQPRRALLAGNGGFALASLALVTAALTITVIWVGSYLTESGASFACLGWPRCNGSFFPEGSHLVRVHWLHRLLGAALAPLVLALAVQGWRLRRCFGVLVTGSALAAPLLYIVQVMLGATNIWYDMAAESSVAHLATATALWGSLVAVVAGVPLGVQPRPALHPAPEARG